MSVIEQAKKLRPIIVQAMQNTDDKTASEAPTLFDPMRYTSGLIKAGTKINWNGIVKKATTDLWDREDQNPDNAPTLWVDLKYRDGIRIIPSPITVSEAFAKDEFGWWENKKYKSLVDNNVYTPAQYPQNWGRNWKEVD